MYQCCDPFLRWKPCERNILPPSHTHSRTVLVWVALEHSSPLTMFLSRWWRRAWWTLPQLSASYDSRGPWWFNLQYVCVCMCVRVIYSSHVFPVDNLSKDLHHSNTVGTVHIHPWCCARVCDLWGHTDCSWRFPRCSGQTSDGYPNRNGITVWGRPRIEI